MDFTATEVLLSQLEVQVCQLYGLFLKTTLEHQSEYNDEIEKKPTRDIERGDAHSMKQIRPEFGAVLAMRIK